MNRFTSLYIVCSAYQPWLAVKSDGAFDSEGAIIKAASHAQPMTMFIEAEQGRYDEVEPLRFTYSITVEHWLGYTEAIELHGRERRPWHEPQSPAKEWMQHGQVTTLAHLIRDMQQRQGIYLTPGADIGGDTACALELGKGRYLCTDGDGCALLFFGGK